MRGDGDERRGQERPDDAEHRDRVDRAAEATPADVHAAVEQDHDQRDDPDALDGRDVDPELREDVRRDRGGDQQQRRRRDRQPLRELERREREQDRDGDHEHVGVEGFEELHERERIGLRTAKPRLRSS